MNVDRKGCPYIHRSIHYLAIHAAKRKLLVLVKIIVARNGGEIVDINKVHKTHLWISDTMLLKMLHQIGHPEQLMKLRKCQHVQSQE